LAEKNPGEMIKQSSAWDAISRTQPFGSRENPGAEAALFDRAIDELEERGLIRRHFAEAQRRGRPAHPEIEIRNRIPGNQPDKPDLIPVLTNKSGLSGSFRETGKPKTRIEPDRQSPSTTLLDSEGTTIGGLLDAADNPWCRDCISPFGCPIHEPMPDDPGDADIDVDRWTE
jgi:hypothetical protein